MFSAGQWCSNPCRNVPLIQPCRCSSTSIMAAKLLSPHIYLGTVAHTHSTHTNAHTNTCSTLVFLPRLRCNTAGQPLHFYYCTENHRRYIGCRYTAEQTSRSVCMYFMSMCSYKKRNISLRMFAFFGRDSLLPLGLYFFALYTYEWFIVKAPI